MSLLEKEWYIEAPWGRIAIIAWGNCTDPPVLLCHGSIDSAVSFRPLVSLLPKNFYYIALDLPGNGKSDRFLPGLMVSVFDLVYSLHAVVTHFRWNKFIYIGHSSGAYLGKLYNLCYPDEIDRLVDLDAINFTAIEPENFTLWYRTCFTEFFENYEKFNAPKGKAPRIKWTEALKTLRENRPTLSAEQASAVLERLTEPAGEGHIRYTYDLRMKRLMAPAYSPEHIRRLYTNVKTPILSIVSKESLDAQLFRNTTFLLDETQYPAKNLRYREIIGGHDAHISSPENIATFVGQFLLFGLEGLDNKAKL
ncbi:serine hydrolase-like protein 2 [Trichoplusia ni]|uniref:Serine hydrolase-like protein 2 n=1 Tax=Trichoplusia ni TaxID=7111 RepID=A0A7E5VBN5_TRINI|nr:serine hydrolase-like protein 2 [Trichoplusia ni]